MLLDQAITEVRQPKLLLANDERLLTPAGRSVLRRVPERRRPHRLRRRPRRRHPPHHRARPARAPARGDPRRRGGLAGRRRNWPPPASRWCSIRYVDLPDSFDSVGSTLENAARLQRAGVKIAFSFGDPRAAQHVQAAPGRRRSRSRTGCRTRPPLAAMTRNPAEIFGVADRNGRSSAAAPRTWCSGAATRWRSRRLADEVFIQGVRQQMRSRQTELRDRYLPKVLSHTAR